MAWRDGDLWVAACLDYTLAAQGYSLDEAKTKLHAQISTYVHEAMTVDSAHAGSLLARKAPLLDRVRYDAWYIIQNRPRLRQSLARLLKGAGVRVPPAKKVYLEPLPLVAA